MKTTLNKSVFLLLVAFLGAFSPTAFAGNEDRIGSAGAVQLLMNPWARSAGLSGANLASGSPVESMWLNVAGLAFVGQTELQFTNVNYLAGAGIGINSFGLAQRVGDGSVIGLSIMSTSFGDIPRTTTDQPEGTGTFFSPSTVNIAISYAKEFSNSIYGGMTLRLISESISDLRASGVSIDAGIKYVTGEFDQIKLGISLKNVGPTIQFEGDGLSFETFIPPTDYPFTLEVRSEDYELPALVAIGGSYDFLLSEMHVLTPHIAFISNSFSSDQYLFGLEYAFNKLFFLRAGYDARRSQFDQNGSRVSALAGFSAGASVDFPLRGGKTRMCVDYAYRTTNPFNGIHSIGARIAIGSRE